MSTTLKPIFESLEILFDSCDIDYALLKEQTLDEAWFKDYSNQRIVNSFLFNYIKIHDRLEVNLFRKLLFSLREINSENMVMIDILNRLEKLEIIQSVADWDRLREIRNVIAHEYPSNIEERLENIGLALSGYAQIKRFYANIKQYTQLKGIV